MKNTHKKTQKILVLATDLTVNMKLLQGKADFGEILHKTFARCTITENRKKHNNALISFL